MMNIYHVYIMRDDQEKWIALALYSTEQAILLGQALHEIIRIETWNGDVVYKAKHKRTVH